MTPPDLPDDLSRDVADDPTGVRAMLGALPDPGRMPDAFAARITAALAAESAATLTSATSPTTAGTATTAAATHSSAITSVATPDAPPPLAPVVHLDTVRRPRRLPRLALVAGIAGVALAGGFGVVSLTSQGDASTASSAVAGAAADGQDSRALAPDASASTPGGTAAVAGPAALVTVVMSGHAYAGADLSAVAGATGALNPTAAESPGIGPIGTEVGARTCATALGIPATATLLVDLSTVDGAPAAVVLATVADGRTAYAVARDCTTGHPALIAGPVNIP